MFELRNVARSLLAGERPGKDRRREEQSHHFHGGALHGLGVQQGVGSMHMSFEFPEKKLFLPALGVEFDQGEGWMFFRI